jgi:leader peptidase (prepilin peptidase)/N-methyltransferase
MSSALIASRAFLVLFGPFAGDYAATLASAWPRGPRPVLGRSHCSRCGAAIAATAQVPLVSWALQRGRRTCCGGRIPLVYPIGEAAGLAIGVAAACATSFTVQAWIFAVGLTLTYIALVDLRRFSIPAWGLAALGVEVAITIAAEPSMAHRLARLAGGGALALGLETLRRFGGRGRGGKGRAGLGAGDVMLAGLLGALVGWRLAAPVVSLAALAPLAMQWLRRRSGPVAFGLWLNIAAGFFLVLVECNLLAE